MVAILSPHLDDAALSAWCVLRRDDRATVVNVFDGVPPAGTRSDWDRRTGARDSSERMRERLDEDRRALAIAGRPSRSIGLLEVQYRDGPVDSARLDAALREATDDAEELWAPAGIGPDAHADHLLVRDWALARAPAGGLALHLYAELPYAIHRGWPGPGPGWERFLPPEATLEPRAERLDDDEVRLKLEALREYRTQWAALDGPKGIVSNPLVIAHEVSWLVRA
jgi:LmbE family N-acetylglucosaminyl deacetylase